MNPLLPVVCGLLVVIIGLIFFCYWLLDKLRETREKLSVAYDFFHMISGLKSPHGDSNSMRQTYFANAALDKIKD